MRGHQRQSVSIGCNQRQSVVKQRLGGVNHRRHLSGCTLSRVTVGVDAVSQSYISRRPGGRVGEGKGDKGKVKGKGRKRKRRGEGKGEGKGEEKGRKRGGPGGKGKKEGKGERRKRRGKERKGKKTLPFRDLNPGLHGSAGKTQNPTKTQPKQNPTKTQPKPNQNPTKTKTLPFRELNPGLHGSAGVHPA